MSRIPGITLEKAWPTLKKSQRRKIARQLARHLRQMRKLPQPPELAGAVISFTGDVLDDPGLNPVWYKGRDIFSSTEDFVNELLDPIERDIGKLCEDTIRYKALLIEQKNLKLYLTHADLAMRNIIVDPVATEVKGIIDWTTAAFLPRYWEAYKAIWSENKVNRQKRRFVQDAFGAFPEEQAVLMRREAAIAGKCEERSLLARRGTELRGSMQLALSYAPDQ